jgi:hypothetical protein
VKVTGVSEAYIASVHRVVVASFTIFLLVCLCFLYTTCRPPFLAYISNLNIGTICFPEKSLEFFRMTQRHIP